MTWLCLNCHGEVTLVADLTLPSTVLALWSDLGLVWCPYCGGLDGARRKG